MTQSLLAHDTEIPQYKRFLQFASPTFDVSQFEIWFTFFRGSTLIACNRGNLLDDLVGVMNEMKVDAAELTPTVAGSLLRDRKAVPQLRLLLTIGEMLTQAVVEEFGGSFKKQGILYGMYGPTEAAIHCTLQSLFAADSKVGLIGRPLKTVSAFIMAPHTDGRELEIVPAGYVGELVVGGHQLAVGYLNRDSETRSAFIYHPLYGLLYRTGDKARMLPDDTLECTGRIATGQVKLRGQRIELGEVEQAAVRAQGCSHAVAVVYENNLVVFCLMRNSSCSHEDVTNACKEFLPSYMLPNEVVLQTEFPRLPSGKVDKQTLVATYRTSVADADSLVVQSTESTLVLCVCDIVRGVVKHPVTQSSRLARLGIDSIGAIRLAAAFRSQGFELSAIEILKCKTVDALCTLVRTKPSLQQKEDTVSKFPMKSDHLRPQSIPLEKWELVQGMMPCTALQTSMLAETVKDPGAYCNWVELEFASDLTIENISASLHKLVKEQSMLRTGFALNDGPEQMNSVVFEQYIWHEIHPDMIEIGTCPQEYAFRLSGDELLHPLHIHIFQQQAATKALIQMHHSLYDGWSLDLLLVDLSQILRGEKPSSRAQFSKVTEFHCDWYGYSQDRVLARDYWENQLLGFKPVKFPSLSPYRVKSCPLSTATHSVAIPAQALQRPHGHEYHAQVVLQSALAYLLHLYLAIDDVCFGVVTSGRTIAVAGIEDIIGPCIATFPMRVACSANRQLAELLKDVHLANRAMLEYGILSLSELKRLSDVDLRVALFDVLFVWQESPVDAADHPGVKISNSKDDLEFNLVIEAEVSEGKLCLKARYRQSLIPEDHMSVFLQQLEAVVQSILKSEDQEVRCLSSTLLESTNLLSIENPDFTRHQSPVSISSYVEAHALTRPAQQAISIIEGSHGRFVSGPSLTYEDLNARSNRLARVLQDHAVKPDDLVCVYMEKSIDLYVSILAVLKAGSGYLPLTPTTPTARVATILQDANVRVCLSLTTSPKLAEELQEVLVIQVDELDLSQVSAANLGLPFVPNNLAYAVFTSGSTGQPKGVQCTQLNLASNISTLAKLYPSSSDSRLLQSCSQAFDVSVFEIFFAWYIGMCLYSGTNDVLFRDLEEVIRFAEITHLSLTPTVAALIEPDNVPSVGFLVTAGEAVTENVFRCWAGKGLWQGYGPSETTNIDTVSPFVTPDHAINNIGRPLNNTSAFVLADSTDFVALPRGGHGELCFGGEQVFRGYMNMPELNASKIIDHPQYGRLYRSGDLGRILHDGTILISGRLDDQVKIRGQRIELGEISRAILDTNRIPLIDGVTLVIPSSEPSSEQLISFCIQKEREKADCDVLKLNKDMIDNISALHSDLRDLLPSYMLPSAIILLTCLPATTQAKIDKRRLLSLYKSLDAEYLKTVSFSEAQDDDQWEWTEEEREIGQALAEFKNVPIETISRHASFFSLGIDSLSAIQLARLVRNALERNENAFAKTYEVNVSTILRYSSIARLAGHLQSTLNREERPNSFDISKVFSEEIPWQIRADFKSHQLSVKNVLPCTPLQEAFLLSNEASNQHTTFRVVGDLDQLHRAFAVVFAQHDIMRTCFVSVTDPRFAFAQVVLDEYDVQWVDDGALDDHEVNAKHSTACVNTVVDTFRPPVSVSHYQCGGSTYLTLSMNHSTYDGEAMTTLLADIEAVYAGKVLPPSVEFEPVLQEILSVNLSRTDVYWERVLQDYVALPLPRLATGKCSISMITHTLSTPYEILQETGSKLSVTPLAILQTAWARVHSAFIRTDDICFGNVVSGRSLPVNGIDRLVAPCFNTIPVRLNASTTMTLSDAAQKLQHLNAESLQHQFTPLRRIQSRWSDTGEQLFDALFLLQNLSKRLDASIWTLEQESGSMGYPLCCEVVPDVQSDALHVNLHIERSCLSEEDALNLVTFFDAVVQEIVRHPHQLFTNIAPPKSLSAALDVRQILIAQEIFDLNDIEQQMRSKIPKYQMYLFRPLTLSPSDDTLVVLLEGSAMHEDHKGELQATLKAFVPSRCSLVVVTRQNAAGSNIGRPAARIVKRLLLRAYQEEVDRATSNDSAAFEHETSEIVRAVIAAFSQFAKVPIEQTSASKTIYQLGLDSISAIQVAKLLRNQGHRVTASDVLANPTAIALAAQIKRSRSENSMTSTPAFDFASFDAKYRESISAQHNLIGVGKVRPCTALQSGMLSQFLRSNDSLYFNHSVYNMQPGIDMARMRAAWQSVVGRHEMLRTGFVSVDDAAFPFAMVTYVSFDLGSVWHMEHTDAAPLDRMKAQRSRFAQEVRRTLQDPPWRISIATTKEATYMQFSAHHALYDVESLQVMLEDVYTTYQGHEQSKPAGIEPLLSTILSSAADADGVHEHFWKEDLKDVPVHKFPVMTPLRIDTRHTVSSNHKSSTNADDLHKACRELNITLQAAVQVAWARLLSGYVGDPEINYGVVFAGRESDGGEEVMFPASTTVPYRSIVVDDVNHMLKSAMSFNTSVRQHQHSSLSQIQRWVGHSQSALFDTILVLQGDRADANKQTLFTLVDDAATVEYTVSMEISRGRHGLEYQLVSWSDVLPGKQAAIMLKQFDLELCHVLGLETPSEPTQSVELFSRLPPRLATLPSSCNTLHGLFEATADKHPNRIALEWVPNLEAGTHTQTWTYSELESDANRLSDLLIARGFKSGSMIAVCFEKCAEAEIAILAVLKAGCSFVALDPGAPVARKAFILEDSGARVLLSTTNLREAVHTDHAADIIFVDSVDIAGYSSQRPDIVVDPQNISYCLYTSGSTGTPKGCLLTHENAVQAMLAFQILFANRWDEKSRWLQFASFHFDVAVLELFWSWSVGICLVSTPRDILFQDLPGTLSTLGITHIDLTPSLARLITPADVPSLCKGVFITGGEQLKQEVLDAWGETGCIHNGYGPTEATIGVTMYTQVPHNGRPSNIGWQFENVGTYVLKPDTNEIVPRGAVGELCISGKLVGKGYLNRPEQTANSFPYVEGFDERIYRTSDLVRLLHDGSFDFLGRSDDQVKLRGQRLELGEINTTIMSVKGIDEVTTQVLKPSNSKSDQLVAFVVVKTPIEDQGDERLLALQDADVIERAKQACADHLPGYMLPSHFIMLTHIPLTVNNKSDSKALKSVYLDYTSNNDHAASQGSERSLTQHEASIARVISSFYSISADTISPSSNIFQLGLDSISVYPFTRALHSAGFAGASPSQVLQTTTIAGLATVLRREDDEASASILAAKQSIIACHQLHIGIMSSTLGVSMDEVEAIAPCTALQQGMIARAISSNTGMYFNSFIFELDRDIDLDKLRCAWERVHEALPILRTCFLQIKSGYVQVVLKCPKLSWVDVTIAHIGDLHTQLQQLKDEWLEQNKEIIGAPFQVICLNVGGRLYMLLHIFHALYDASSLPLLLNKVVQAHNDDEDIDFGPQFLDILPYGPLKQIENVKTFWISSLEHAAYTTTSKEPEDPDNKSSSATLLLNDLASFEATRRQLGCTHQAIIQTCWLTVLFEYLHGPTTVGTIVSGRSIGFPGAEKTIGPLFNTIPLCIDIQAKDTWASVVARCHQFNVAALPYQHTPLRDITKWCKKSGQRSLFDTLFVFQKSLAERTSHLKTPWHEIESAGQADYPLSFEAVQEGEQALKVTIVAQTYTASASTCKKLLQTFENKLRGLLKDPQASIADYTRGWSPISDVAKTEKKHTVDQTGMQHFAWDSTSLRLRDEIAKISGVNAVDIGATTSIFELGLDSIDAIKLSALLKKSGNETPVSTILRLRTIAKIVGSFSIGSADDQRLDDDSALFQAVEKAVRHQAAETGLDMSGVVRILPTTPLQEGMLAEMVASDYKHYFNHDLLRLHPVTDVVRLQKAWQRAVASSPILRTSFVIIDQPDLGISYAQVEHERHPGLWEELDLSHNDSLEDIYERVRQDMSKTSQSSLVPLRLTLVKRQDDQFLLLSIAHALYDGWSIGLLHGDVSSAYNGITTHRIDHVQTLRRILNQSAGDAPESFWRTLMSGVTPSLVATKQQRLAGSHRNELGSSISSKAMREFCRAQGVTLQALGQLCWGFTLASYTKSLDVCFGLVLAGRDDDEAQQVMFPTMNTVVVRLILHGTCSEMLQYAQDNLADIMHYQHFLLRKIKALANVAGQELFNTLFIYQKRPSLSEKDEPLYDSVGGSSDVDYPVAIEMEVVEDTLVWRSACSAAYFGEDDAKEMLQRLDTVLKHIVEHPDTPLLEFRGEEVSICGLPPFAHDQKATEAKDRLEHVSEDPISVPVAWTSTEQALRAALAAVSGVPQQDISKHQTIFHIGLDSISAIKVATYLSRHSSMKVSVSTVLKAGSLDKIAATIDAAKYAHIVPVSNAQQIVREALRDVPVDELLQAYGIDRSNVEVTLPASATQVYFLSTWQNSQGELFYPTFHYRISSSGTFSVDALCRAWKMLVTQQPMLRTIFVATGRNDLPVLHCVLHDIESDLSFSSNASDEDNPLLQKGSGRPPVSLRVIGQDEVVRLELRIHHALYDAVSLATLIQDLQKLYNSQSTAPSSVQDIETFLASHIAPDVATSVKEKKTFWKNYFATTTPAPASKPLAWPSEAYETSRTSYYVPRAVLNISRLDLVLHTNGISLQSLFLACIALCRARLSDRDASPLRENDFASDVKASVDVDTVIGIYLANRAACPVLQAPTLCILPLRVQVVRRNTEPCQPEEIARRPNVDVPALLAAARTIQVDLQRISAPEMAGTGLWEIEEWTGVRVDCFVNFLADFEDRTDTGSGDLNHNGSIDEDAGGRIPITIEACDAPDTTQTSASGTPTPSPPSPYANALADTVRSAYIPSIDIEAAVRNEALDIGVFGQSDLVSPTQVGRLVRDVCSILETCANWTAEAATDEKASAVKETEFQTDKENVRSRVTHDLIEREDVADMEQRNEVEATAAASPRTQTSSLDPSPLRTQSQSDFTTMTESTATFTAESTDTLPPLRPRPRPQRAGFRWPRPISVAFGRSGMLAREESSSLTGNGTE